MPLVTYPAVNSVVLDRPAQQGAPAAGPKSGPAAGLFQDKEELTTFFRDLEIQSEPAFDADGSPILKVRYYGEDKILGITRHNILSANSDQELAYKLMLAKISANLNAREKDRSSLEEFRADWELMRRLAASLAASSKNISIVAKNRGRFLEAPIKTNVKRGLFKTFLNITR